MPIFRYRWVIVSPHGWMSWCRRGEDQDSRFNNQGVRWLRILVCDDTSTTHTSDRSYFCPLDIFSDILARRRLSSNLRQLLATSKYAFYASLRRNTASCPSTSEHRLPLSMRTACLFQICNEPAEFNLRLDHGLNEDVREWLTGPVNIL